MQKKVLMTGSTGFIGSNVLSILQENQEYQLVTPHRKDLNLKDESEVREFLKKERFDVVLHFANPTPGKNQLDSYDTLLEDSLRIFMNFYQNRNLFGKMIYSGSGAEYDKTMHMNNVSETECNRSIPKEPYGFGKYIMNQLAEQSENVYNFRIFGCYGPGDLESKFITHCIRSIIIGLPITIRKDCQFDYLHVEDYAAYINWGIHAELKHHNYNVCSGIPMWLSEIAKEVSRQMGSAEEIEILSSEKNMDYTGSNLRIATESGISPRLSIAQGIEKQINWEKANWTSDTKFDGR